MGIPTRRKNTSGGSFDFSLQDLLEASSSACGALYGVELDFHSLLAWRTLLNYRRLKPVSCRVVLRARLFLFIINKNQASVLPSGLCLLLLLWPSALLSPPSLLAVCAPSVPAVWLDLASSVSSHTECSCSLLWMCSHWDKWPALQFTLRQNKQAEKCSTS